MKEPIIVFDRKFGNADNYRIPSLAVTNDGTLVACADERFFTAADNPNRIDKVVRISEDNGETWSEQITAVKMQGKDKQHSSAAIDPALLYDGETDTIFMLYSMTPAGIGILNCAKGTGFEDGGIVVRGGGKKYILRDGELYLKGQPTGIKVDKDGNYAGGNVLTREGGLSIHRTSYLMLIRSEDHGKTWSEPVHLNPSLKADNYHFIGSGPANGIQMKFGKYKGRLVFPIYYGLAKLPMKLTSAVIYSDDHGKTWKRGATPPIKGRYPADKPVIMPMRTYLTESQVVELENGDLLCFMRNHHPKRRIYVSRSTDGGATWTEPEFCEDLPHCVCQITAIACEYEGKRAILTVNAASTEKREKGVARLSLDEGKTFPKSLTITEGEFVYSSAQVLKDGTVGMLYEDCTKHENIKFTKFSLDELK